MQRLSLRNPIPHRLPRELMDPIGVAVARTGLTPNAISVIGVLGNIAAGVLAGAGWFAAAGVVMLVFSAVDLLDGAVARATGRATPFGAVFDATLDRVSEAAVLFGLLWRFTGEGNRTESLLVFAAMTGSILVSYVKARAEVEGLLSREGWFTRVERVIVLGIALIVGLATPALWLLAVATNLTAAQRLWLTWRGLTAREPAGIES